MHLIAEHSHKSGKEFIERHHPDELAEIKQVIAEIDAELYKTKKSREKTMRGRMLYSPKDLNRAYKERLSEVGWGKRRIAMETMIPELGRRHRGYREIDFVKNKLGLEVQFGKYAFMVYNILAKMTIFAGRSRIDSGVEVVAMRDLTKEMSTGVSYFEQVKADLEYRGVADLDIPVLVLGVDAVDRPSQETLVDPTG